MERKVYDRLIAMEEHHWWRVGRRKIFKKVLDTHIKKEKKALSILEIGCGAGGNLSLLSNYGKICGTEIDDEMRSAANDRKCCEVKKGTFLPEGEIPFDEKFDLICMFDVLEHIEDDFFAMKKIVEKLNSGGKLLVAVPSYPSLWSQADVIAHHFRRYTKKSLNTVLQSQNLKILYTTYFNTLLFPIIFFVRKVLKKGSETYDVKNYSQGGLNGVFTKIFTSESLWISKNRSLPFGDTLLMLAQKP